MKGKPGPAATALRPIIDTYRNSALALVGCVSSGIERYSCEYDVLVVTEERLPPTSVRLGDVYADLTFVPEAEVLKPKSHEHAFSLAFAKPVRDTTLVLSTSIAANAAVASESARKASRARLSSSLKVLGRAAEALSKKSVLDADFWLLAGSYEFAYAWLLSKEVLPSPSHLLSQLRASSKGGAGAFEGFSIGAGLEVAGRAGCGARLDGVAVLHDLLREGGEGESGTAAWPAAKSEILAGKAKELMTRIELAECYCFLGQELVEAILTLMKARDKRALSLLAEGKDKLLGERLIRQLGLARSEKQTLAGLEAMKDQVSGLAKRA